MPVERETIVTNSSDNGALVAGVIGAVLLVIILAWILNGGIDFGRATSGTVDVDVPTVTVTPDGQ